MDRTETKILSIDDIDAIRELLEALGSENTHCHAGFFTYRAIQDLGPGDRELPEIGLTLSVRTGGLDAYSDTVTYLSFASVMEAGMGGYPGPILEEQKTVMRVEGAAAAEKLEAADRPRVDLAVVYAGFSAMQQAITFAEDRKREGAGVILVGCDCEELDKVRAGQNGGFDAVIITPECGGRQAMRQIYDLLILVLRERRTA